MDRPDPRRLYLANGFVRGVTMATFSLAAVVWWVVDLELSPLRLVLLGTAMEVAVLLAESPTGVMADRYSRKWSIVVSWGLMGTAQALAGITGSLPVLLVWQALFGIGYTFQSGADTAWVTDEIGRADDALVVGRAIATSFGVAAGLVGAIAATQWSLTGTMALSGVASVGWGLAMAVLMRERGFAPTERSETGVGAMVATWREGLALIARRRVLRTLVTVTFVAATVDELVDRLDLARMRQVGFPDLDGAGSAFVFGSVWLAMTVVTIPVMVAVQRRGGAPGDRRSALTLAILLGATALGVGLMATPVFALAVFGWVARDVSREVAEPVGEAWVNRHATSGVRATVISMRNQSISAGEIGGGLALGAVAELVGLPTAFVLGAVLLAGAALLVAGAGRPEPVGAVEGGGGFGGASERDSGNRS